MLKCNQIFNLGKQDIRLTGKDLVKRDNPIDSM